MEEKIMGGGNGFGDMSHIFGLRLRREITLKKGDSNFGVTAVIVPKNL